MKFDRTKMIEALLRVVQRLHYPLEVMLVCVRWYAAYPLSFRNIEVMHMIRKGQLGAIQDRASSVANQFFSLAF